MKIRLALLLTTTAVVLGGCSWAGNLLKSDKVDYKSESAGRSAPSLEVPPELSTPTRDGRFALPADNRPTTAVASEVNAQRPAAAAGNSAVLPTISSGRLERAGTQRWLVVAGKPDQLWPVIKDFWTESGFTINIDRPEAGVLETDWAENRAKLGMDGVRRLLGTVFDGLYSTPERDKFRTRLEQGASGETEIYISHRGMVEIYKTEGRDQTVWQPRAVDPELEAEFLRRLLVRLGTDDASARRTIEAGARPPERARIVTAGNASRVELEEGFDRAWRRVGLALDRVGFTVEDRDRSKGVYFVRYADPDMTRKAPDGFIGRMTGWFRTTTERPAEQYQISVTGQTSATQIAVLSKTGVAEQSETSRRILSLLHEQLK
jgi:outer membrane protein assembly factor BamC